jgi:SAM-dependent methyltransferase
MAEAYDDIPYPDFTFADQHPFHIAGLAQLWGIETPPALGARVLEIGCASGANLLFMAETAPHLQFTGIELSKSQAHTAQRRIGESGLSNVRVLQGSFTEISKEESPFDYILCHGLYSWVPPEVRRSLTNFIAHSLSPKGIVYLSYNCLPGWMFKGYIRELLLHIAPPTLPNADRLARLKELLPTVKSVVSPFNPARSWILPLLQKLESSDPSYLFHEYLSEWNQPFWFKEVVHDLGQSGLQYLCETDPAANATYDYSGESLTRLETLAPHAPLKEEFLDFMRCPAFRRSLFSRSANEGQRSIDYTKSSGLFFCLAPGISLNELSSGGFELSKTNSPTITLTGVPAACLKVLVNAHPGYCTGTAVSRELAASEPDIAQILCELVRAGFVLAYGQPLPVATTASPRLCYLTKMFLQTSETTVTARGERVTVTPEIRKKLASGRLSDLDEQERQDLLREGLFLASR